MQTKSGKKISVVKPVKPEEVFEADDADPGKVEKAKAEQEKKQAGKYGKQPVAPYKPPGDDAADEKKTSWIEIEMIDEADDPVAGVKYEIKLPDGTVASGVLDNNGFARVDGIEPGQCEVGFPELDKDAWKGI